MRQKRKDDFLFAKSDTLVKKRKVGARIFMDDSSSDSDDIKDFREQMSPRRKNSPRKNERPEMITDRNITDRMKTPSHYKDKSRCETPRE